MNPLREEALRRATNRIVSRIAPTIAAMEISRILRKEKRRGFPPGIRGSLVRVAAERLRELRGEPDVRSWRSRYERAGITEEFWLRLEAAFEGVCAYCGRKPESLTIDHVTPRDSGGRGGEDDVLPACGPCNSRKQNRSVAWLLARLNVCPDEFRDRVEAARGKLARKTNEADAGTTVGAR